MRDRFNKIMGRTRFVVCRLFLHLGGQDLAPLLRLLNRTAREAIDADGDLEVLGEGLVELCQTLLQYDEYWLSAANEGDVFWYEGEAGDYVNELFTDSASRYFSETDYSSSSGFVSKTVTRNLIVMITVAYEGEVPNLETDLSNIPALKAGFKALINLFYQDKYWAIQVHFSPAHLGDELTNDQLLQYYPELISLITKESISQPSAKAIDEAIEVFFSYAHEDEELQKELVNHLSILKRQNVIKDWHDRQISAGTEWQTEIDKHLYASRIILLLVSSDFLASDDCYNIVERAMERHAAGKACVIPVILREVDLEGIWFGKLQALPEGAKPVTSWQDRDAAFSNVARGIRKVVEELASQN